MSEKKPETKLLQAAWIAPMSVPPIPEAAVVFAGGRITDVGPADAVRARNPAAEVQDLGNVLLTPGLVNAHTHLELSEMTPGAPPASFADWLISLMSRLFATGDAGEAARRGTQRGIEQCLRFGVTSVADTSARPGVTRAVLATSPLRVTSYGEIRAMGDRRVLLKAQLDAALDQRHADDRLRIGVSPHAPYTVEPDGYQACLTRGGGGARITTHLAETPDEEEFLRSHTGPLRRVWDWRGGWDDAVPKFDGSPIRFAEALGLLDQPTLLAHVNYVDPVDLRLLVTGKASVVYCPRTHTYFKHQRHPWELLLNRGVNVCLGTDSCASSPDLNLLDDVRLLHRIAPHKDTFTLWQMATWNGAKAMALADVGTIQSNFWADLISFPVGATDDPLTDVLESDVLPEQCWIGGELVARGGAAASRPHN